MTIMERYQKIVRALSYTCHCR